MSVNAKSTSTSCPRELRARRQSRDWIKSALLPAKQLFTPEIKHHLKTWLVRRRNNPYPTKQEKIRLAVDTGLTYIQVSNWFANWRRKLKNRSQQLGCKTWTTLIQSYNNNVQGNVELISLGSNDSIWNETKELISSEYKRRKRKSYENENSRKRGPRRWVGKVSDYLRSNNDSKTFSNCPRELLKHEREEIDAAEALTTLSRAAHAVSSQYKPITA